MAATAVLMFIGTVLPATGAAAASGFSTRVVVARLGQGAGGLANAFAFAPGGRIFVARKAGVVDVYDHGTEHVFVDLNSEVNSAQGRGMLGLALDPHFAVNGRVYLQFTTTLHGQADDSRADAGGEIISIRARAGNPDAADLSTRVVLLRGYNSSAPQHADGALRFDGAGNLLAGWGDGTPDGVARTALAAQSLNDLRGKIVRIDPDTGAGVAGNPFYDAAHRDATKSKIYVYGLRNPYRFTVDPQNGTLYVGDVGWTHYDELDAFPVSTTDPVRDRNGGWPCYEGANGHSAAEPSYRHAAATRAACKAVYPPGALGGHGVGAHAPLWAYPHDQTSCIIGGPKYTGTSNYPSRYDGQVFVADWARDTFHTVNPTTGVATALQGSDRWGNPLDIQIAPDGNVAYLAQATNSVREIVYSG
jgi:glucose/arabinose dehydrogenase